MCISILDYFLKISTLVVLFITMVYVIKYWRETQQMKVEMVRQSKISIKNIKIQNLPLIDLQLEVVKPSPNSVQGKIQFAYDLYLKNTGNGPAFIIRAIRYITPEKDAQKRATYKESKRELSPFDKEVKMLGVGKKVKIHREHSSSYESFKIEVSYYDHFREKHSIVFTGDKDCIKILEYEHQNNFYS